ncbi:hypothetical protein CAEBREN_16254 [Caenorhabditis brenneri]|uniref:RING-type domain-containing protein n=1 Tax=Caenorhabditis brenneri TaxID=135651 RepID=G0P469_CAEBE|nr:hypothetical protein CAEBREN_16254 [Caenorhabditis brenneri]
MPAPKRRCFKTPQAPKRGAKESPNENPRTIQLLKECSKKQRDHIACLNKFLISQERRFQRLQLHVKYQLQVDQMRLQVRNFTEQQIKEHEQKISSYNRQKIIGKIAIEEMEKQEETVEKIVEEVVKYKRYRLQEAEETVEIEPTPSASYEQELKDALLNIPATFRDDSEMESVPKLKKNDLEEIEFPELIDDWTQYSMHWDKEIEEAAECRKLNEEIHVLSEKLAEVQAVYEGARARKERIMLYDENRKCPIHDKKIRNFERTVFSSCGHTVCASCMQQFKDRNSLYQWRCHQCREPSDKVLTNWALMQLIKEVPGQPQREVNLDALREDPIVRVEDNPFEDLFDEFLNWQPAPPVRFPELAPIVPHGFVRAPLDPAPIDRTPPRPAAPPVGAPVRVARALRVQMRDDPPAPPALVAPARAHRRFQLPAPVEPAPVLRTPPRPAAPPLEVPIRVARALRAPLAPPALEAPARAHRRFRVPAPVEPAPVFRRGFPRLFHRTPPRPAALAPEVPARVGRPIGIRPPLANLAFDLAPPAAPLARAPLEFLRIRRPWQ